MKKKQKRNKRVILIIGTIIVLIAIIAVICFGYFHKGDHGFFATIPTVTIETPQKINKDCTEIIDLNVEISTLGENLYPAASFCISFDPSKLEFVGIKEGTVRITDSRSSSGYQLPTWSVNVEKSNEIGQINLMYLDMTGGKYAFTKEALDETENVLFHLCFRLRGSAKKGDIYELCLEDAIFANVEEEKSLAMTTNTLETENGRIVVDE